MLVLKRKFPHIFVTTQAFTFIYLGPLLGLGYGSNRRSNLINVVWSTNAVPVMFHETDREAVWIDWFENSIHPLNEAWSAVISFYTGVRLRHSVSIQRHWSRGPCRVPDGPFVISHLSAETATWIGERNEPITSKKTVTWHQSTLKPQIKIWLCLKWEVD